MISLNTFNNPTATPPGDDSVPGPTAFVINNAADLEIDGVSGLTQGVTLARDPSAAPFRLFFVSSASGSSTDAVSALTLVGLTLRGGLAQGFSAGPTVGRDDGGPAGEGPQAWAAPSSTRRAPSPSPTAPSPAIRPAAARAATPLPAGPVRGSAAGCSTTTAPSRSSTPPSRGTRPARAAASSTSATRSTRPRRPPPPART
jgi:hypothetical protein